jgi:hypothetical protein
VVERLGQKELLPSKLIATVKDIVPILNRAIHGESLAPDSVEWALAYGNLLVNELEKLSPAEV